jgi:hypothetical protein
MPDYLVDILRLVIFFHLWVAGVRIAMDVAMKSSIPLFIFTAFFYSALCVGLAHSLLVILGPLLGFGLDVPTDLIWSSRGGLALLILSVSACFVRDLSYCPKRMRSTSGPDGTPAPSPTAVIDSPPL